MHKSVRAIIEKDGGIILIHRVKPNDDGTYKDYYVVPGGKMEEGETEEETVVREVVEELGIKINPEEKILFSELSESIKLNLKLIKDSDLSDEEKAEKQSNEKVRFNKLKDLVGSVQNKICNGADFMSEAFGNSPEKEIFVSNITLNKSSAKFLMSFGCDKFAKFSDNSCFTDKIKVELESII